VGGPLTADTARAGGISQITMSSMQELAQHWKVVLTGPVIESPTGRVAFGRRGSTDVVLKVPKPDDDEANSLAALLHFDGHGAVSVLDHLSGAMLMERVTPGHPLTELAVAGRDDEATAALCDVVASLHRRDLTAAISAQFPSVEDWGSELAPCRSGIAAISAGLIERAISVFAELAGSQGPRRLLHGDLHHHNILYDDRYGWLAIDPKGVIGESAYEIGAALRNPTEDPAMFAVRSIIERRIAIVRERLGLDPDRVLRWAFAQGVLSAVWRALESRDPTRGLATAEAILPMLRS
jgi:streptomycin 6-kinase